MAKGRRAAVHSVYQLKVTLMETDSPIWRRLRVPGNTTRSRLDRVTSSTTSSSEECRELRRPLGST